MPFSIDPDQIFPFNCYWKNRNKQNFLKNHFKLVFFSPDLGGIFWQTKIFLLIKFVSLFFLNLKQIGKLHLITGEFYIVQQQFVCFGTSIRTFRLAVYDIRASCYRFSHVREFTQADCLIPIISTRTVAYCGQDLDPHTAYR